MLKTLQHTCKKCYAAAHEVINGKARGFLIKVDTDSLGAAGFKHRYGLRHAYMAGAMYKAIASKELVERMACAQLLSSLGTGGCSLEQIEQDIDYLSKKLKGHYSFAANVICNLDNPSIEQKTVEILLHHGVTIAEASVLRFTLIKAQYLNLF